MTSSQLCDPGPRHCPPRFATARNLERDTLGGHLATVSTGLGKPFMPWQQQVADVAMEINPRTNRLAYRQVLVTVPRQSGKTTQILAVIVHRALAFDPPQQIIYTAQTRGMARRKWAEEHVPAIQASRYGRQLKPDGIRYANDSEAMFFRNGSRYGIESGTKSSGHGTTLDLAFIDEAFAEVDSRKEGAFRPAMVTRPEPQLWIVSTAGDASSTYLKGKVDAGRANCLSGTPSSTAYFEWSAQDDDDPDDPETWWRCMPALGHTISIEAIQGDHDAMQDDPAEFARAYLNRWRDDTTAENVWIIPEADWLRAMDPDSTVRRGAPITLCVDVTPDRSWAAIGLSGPRHDDTPHIELIEHRPGTSWVADRLVELSATWNIPQPVLLAGPAAGALQADLTREQIPHHLMSLSETVQAAGQIVSRATAEHQDPLDDESPLLPPRVWHTGQLQVDTALAGATKRMVGSGDAFAFDKRTGTDICPLVAVAGALFGELQRADVTYSISSSIY